MIIYGFVSLWTELPRRTKRLFIFHPQDCAQGLAHAICLVHSSHLKHCRQQVCNAMLPLLVPRLPQTLTHAIGQSTSYGTEIDSNKWPLSLQIAHCHSSELDVFYNNEKLQRASKSNGNYAVWEQLISRGIFLSIRKVQNFSSPNCCPQRHKFLGWA